MQVPFCKVSCDGRELEYIRTVVDSGWLTTAGMCFEFEKRFAEHVGAKFACAVNSCTAALHLAAEAIGIGRGDKVFVPTMTFTASAEVLRYLEADPIFLDVEYGTTLLSPEILEEGIKKHPDVKAVMLVHYGGQAARMDEIIPLCQKYGLRIIEDAAHAFPTKLNGRYVGSFGDVTCFSFYANKTITTGEGGMLTTDQESIYQRVKTMRLHGINRDIWDRFTSKSGKWEYDVIAPGFKYNMPDINAAIGLAQLERAEEFRVQRQRCAEYYFERLSDLRTIDLPVNRTKSDDHSWHLYPVVLNDRCHIERNSAITALTEKGIGTSVHYKPLHRMTYYRQTYRLNPDDFPNAERMWKGNISLPIFPTMSEAQLDYVVESLKELLTER